MPKNKIINNYGILASISWNSNKWADDPTGDDAKRSKYGYVKDNSYLYKKYPEGNIKAFSKNIIYFENPVEINNNIII
jgi:hypothetical protein